MAFHEKLDPGQGVANVTGSVQHIGRQDQIVLACLIALSFAIVFNI